jgi:hypothetical protein
MDIFRNKIISKHLLKSEYLFAFPLTIVLNYLQKFPNISKHFQFLICSITFGTSKRYPGHPKLFILIYVFEIHTVQYISISFLLSVGNNFCHFKSHFLTRQIYYCKKIFIFHQTLCLFEMFGSKRMYRMFSKRGL